MYVLKALIAYANDGACFTNIASDAFVDYLSRHWDNHPFVCRVVFLLIETLLAEIEIWALVATPSKLH